MITSLCDSLLIYYVLFFKLREISPFRYIMKEMSVASVEIGVHFVRSKAR